MIEIKEEIGQLFILGIKETEITSELEEFIKEFKPGGIILFEHNIRHKNQVMKLISDLQSISEEALFICIDHEGGRIFRFQDDFGITHYPSLKEFSRNSSPEVIKKMGDDYGHELVELGINVNFAPVLDLFTNPNNTVTNDRSFGSDPIKVAEFGEIFIKFMQAHGVFACAKHFPGIGEAVIDPHKKLAEIDLSYNELKNRELIPFIRAFEAGVEFVMPSHIYYSKIEPSKFIPATLSKVVITEILREKLGFKGLVVSDDMTMGAILERNNLVKDCFMSFMAGTDLILICWDIEKALKARNHFIDSYNENDDFKNKVNESLHKVEILKKKIRI